MVRTGATGGLGAAMAQALLWEQWLAAYGRGKRDGE
jgi:NAD(P)-dependent dehydrogenase (short-subunit alcohol dehydrogenase family)